MLTMLERILYRFFTSGCRHCQWHVSLAAFLSACLIDNFVTFSDDREIFPRIVIFYQHVLLLFGGRQWCVLRAFGWTVPGLMCSLVTGRWWMLIGCWNFFRDFRLEQLQLWSVSLRNGLLLMVFLNRHFGHSFIVDPSCGLRSDFRRTKHDWLRILEIAKTVLTTGWKLFFTALTWSSTFTKDSRLVIIVRTARSLKYLLEVLHRVLDKLV